MSTLNGAEDRDGEDSKHRPADHESCGARADPSIWCRGVAGAPGQGPLLVAKTPIRLPRTTDRVPDHAPGVICSVAGLPPLFARLDNISWPTRGPNVDWRSGLTMRRRVTGQA